MKSSFSLSNGVMNFKTIIFIISSVVLSLLYVFTSFPVFNETVYSTDPDADNECTITASDSVSINSDCKKITTGDSADNTGNAFNAPDNTSAGSVVTVNLLFKEPVMPSVSD
ncbi:MAG: hypothetical protein FJW66_04755, partial [Actinobacteria bacterium]|nr:hypothetical protein [Actinomycetota bacterium]